MFLMFIVNFVIVTKFPLVLCVLKTVKMICNSYLCIKGVITRGTYKILCPVEVLNSTGSFIINDCPILGGCALCFRCAATPTSCDKHL
jgi:hypothetical protein